MSPDARRVYEAIRRSGRYGVCRIDFEPPEVIDGLKPILNFPGRIREIRDNLGDHAVEWNGRRRGRCKVFVLGTRIPSGPPSPDAEFTCDRGHIWQGKCRHSQLGYPILEGADPCPTCAREPNSVEACIGPAAAEVVAKAAA